ERAAGPQLVPGEEVKVRVRGRVVDDPRGQPWYRGAHRGEQDEERGPVGGAQVEQHIGTVDLRLHDRSRVPVQQGSLAEPAGAVHHAGDPTEVAPHRVEEAAERRAVGQRSTVDGDRGTEILQWGG